jgi:hypothetical protein
VWLHLLKELATRFLILVHGYLVRNFKWKPRNASLGFLGPEWFSFVPKMNYIPFWWPTKNYAWYYDMISPVKSFCSVYSHDLTKVLWDPHFTWTQLSMHGALVLLRRFCLIGAFAQVHSPDPARPLHPRIRYPRCHQIFLQRWTSGGEEHLRQVPSSRLPRGNVVHRNVARRPEVNPSVPVTTGTPAHLLIWFSCSPKRLGVAGCTTRRRSRSGTVPCSLDTCCSNTYPHHCKWCIIFVRAKFYLLIGAHWTQ